MTVTDVMVDLETMGKDSRAAIVSIGAVPFDLNGEPPVLADGFYVNVKLQSSIDAGLTVDGETVEWWLAQSAEARSALLEPAPRKLSVALLEFAAYVGRFKKPRLWAHATFDLPILSSAYAALHMRQPWPYARSRDVRTIYDLAYGSERVPVPDDLRHNALHDAYRQAVGVQLCYRRLVPVVPPDGLLRHRPAPAVPTGAMETLP